MSQPEDKTKKAISKLLNKLWPDCFQLMVVPGGFGKNGIPDHLACVPVKVTQSMVGKTYGMFIGVEAKTEKGKTKGIQHVRIAEIIKSGGFGAIQYGPDVAELESKLIKNFKR